MSDDLQALLDRIRSEGVEKANAEAAEILGKARAEAAALSEKTKAEAAATVEAAKRESEAYMERARTLLGQAARDVRLQLKEDLVKTVSALLAAGVKSEFANTANLRPWITMAIEEYLGGDGAGCALELGGAAAKLAKEMEALLAAKAQKAAVIVSGGSPFDGFKIRLDNGRIEHSFTDEAVSLALSRSLRPELAKLLKDS